jgi:hypothetical protein
MALNDNEWYTCLQGCTFCEIPRIVYMIDHTHDPKRSDSVRFSMINGNSDYRFIQTRPSFLEKSLLFSLLLPSSLPAN